MAIVLALAVVLLVWGIVRSRRARRASTSRPVTSAAVLVGLGIFLVALFVSGMRHYGGSEEVGDGGTASACTAWWNEMQSSHGINEGIGAAPDPACRRAAVDAIGPAVIESALAGVLAAGLTVVYLLRRRPASTIGVDSSVIR